MTSKLSMARVFLMAAALCCFLAPGAGAVTATHYIDFNGALELWNWTQTGKTAIGADVTGATIPNEMADPAKVRLYNPGGSLAAEYRNYRPEPNGFTSMNNFKLGMTLGDGLVSWNLSGLGAPTGVLQSWGQQVTVSGVAEPTAAPDYDNVGTNWFAQNNGGMATWWCEAQANALNKDALDPKRFVDIVALTFDDVALNPDGTVSLWVGGFITGDLAGLEAGTAAYAVLEGRMKRPAQRDDDGDGYYAPTWGNDCCDDPNAPCDARGMGVVTYPEDPEICDTCVCGVAECAPCARCIYVGATDFAGDNIDSNCNGQDGGGCFIATASFGTEMEGKVTALQDLRDRHLLGSEAGRGLVDLYYSFSPPVASYIDARPGLKSAVRTALLPVVGAAWATSHKGALAGMALGLAALGLVLRRREKMGGKALVVLAAAGLVAFGAVGAQADVRAEMDAVIQESGSCMQAVESLLDAGYPAAEVIPAVLAGCRDGVTDVIATAIRSGADPFTVAYAAKGAGVDLQQVVSALEGVTGGTASGEQETAGFQPPSAPVRISSVPVVVTGTGSAWGQTKFVASPSL